MDDEPVLLNKIADMLHSIILKLRVGNKIKEEDLASLSSLTSQLEDELLKVHLDSVIKSFKNNNFDERSILGKSIRLNREELKLISESINEFMKDEPFKGMDSKNVMILWKETLNFLVKELPTEVVK